MDVGEGCVVDQRPRYDCLLFDLDDTLYPLSSGLAAECRKNIHDYMLEKLGIEKGKVPDLAAVLYKNYGTTMAGLRGSLSTNGRYENHVVARFLIFKSGQQRKHIFLVYRGVHFTHDDVCYQKMGCRS